MSIMRPVLLSGKFLRVQGTRFAELVRTRPPPIVILIHIATLASRIARRMRISGEENAPVHNLDREGTYSTRSFDGNAID